MSQPKIELNQTALMTVLILMVCAGAGVYMFMTQQLRALATQDHLMMEKIALMTEGAKARKDSSGRAKLITRREVSRALEEIEVLGHEHAVTFLSMDRLDKAPVSYKTFSSVTIQLETRSAYKQLGLFLRSLDDLRGSIAAVDQFQIIRDPQKTGQVRSKIHIQLILKRDGRG